MIRNKILEIVVILLFLSLNLNAQTFDFEWVGSFSNIQPLNNSGTSYTNDVISDTANNIYTIGFFSGIISFNPNVTNGSMLTSNGDDDIFICKLDASGNYLWVKSIGGINQDFVSAIAIDVNGDLLITGSFSGTVDFDPSSGITNMTSINSFDAFVLKMDTNGNLIWAKQMGGNNQVISQAIATDMDGNVYTTGSFEGTTDFDPSSNITNLTSNGDDDIYVQKLDSLGNFLWTKSIGSAGQDIGRGVKVDNSGNVFVAGSFSGTVDFDPNVGVNNIASNGLLDGFTLKLDINGNFAWIRQTGGTGDDLIRAICIDYNNDLVVTGQISGTVDLDPTIGAFSSQSSGQEDIFVQKLDSNGNFIWATSHGGNSLDWVWGLDIDINNNIYTTGIFTNSLDADPGIGTFTLTSNGLFDIVTQKLSSSGNFIWASQIGGTGTELAYAIDVNTSGDVYTVGFFESNVDFDPTIGVFNLNVGNNQNAFVQKLSQEICSNTFATDIQTACNSYIWIDSNTYTTSNNTATFILQNSAGCDSVITLDLTINTPNVTTTTTYLTITADAQNATYQWLDCNNNNTPIMGETGQSFTATTNGNYAVIVTENGCSDTSACVAITTLNINKLKETSVYAYPNPTQGDLMLSFPQVTTDVLIKVSDTKGQVITTHHYDMVKDIELKLEGEQGIYLITITHSNNNQILRCVKQ